MRGLLGGKDLTGHFSLRSGANSSAYLANSTARARDFYDLAVRWPRTDPRLKPAYLEELDMFRAEAAELLGIEAKKD